MAFGDPLQWIIIGAVVLVVVVAVANVFKNGKSKNERQLVLSIIRAKNGATIDDIIVQGRLSPESAANHVNELIGMHVLAVQNRDGEELLRDCVTTCPKQLTVTVRATPRVCRMTDSSS